MSYRQVMSSHFPDVRQHPVGYFKLRPGTNTQAFRRRRFVRKMRCHLDNLGRLSSAEKVKYILAKLHYAPAKIKHQLWRRVFRLFEKLNQPLPAKLRIIQQFNFLAAYNYTPRIYSGRVSLFSATGDLTAANDLQEGWCALASLGVEVHEIPGDHINIIKEPHRTSARWLRN